MKCDVCQTPIPIGKNECPQCGYKIRVSHVNTYDASGDSHEHIQVRSKTLKERVQPVQAKKSYQKTYKKNSKPFNIRLVKSLLTAIIIGIFIVTIATVFIFTVSDSIFSDFDFFSETTDSEITTFEGMLDADMDTDGTIEMAYKDQGNIVQYLEDADFEDIEKRDYVDLYDNYQYVQSHVYAYYNNNRYTISMSYQKGELGGVELIISGSKEGERSNLFVEEKDVSIITNYLKDYRDDVSKTYDYFVKGHSLMKEDTDSSYDEAYIYSDYSKPDIYMTERRKATSKNEVSYYYSIRFYK